jgi:hypothetical protein
VLPLVLSLVVLRGRWAHFARMIARGRRGVA